MKTCMVLVISYKTLRKKRNKVFSAFRAEDGLG